MSTQASQPEQKCWLELITETWNISLARESQAEKRSSAVDMACGFLNILRKPWNLGCFFSAAAASIEMEIQAIANAAI